MTDLQPPVRPVEIELRPAPPDVVPPPLTSPFEEWGERDPRAVPADVERWIIVLLEDGAERVVGTLSAHSVWYGPNASSRAVNIGVGVVDAHRGRGIGSRAQAVLAQLLHTRGVVRVEASTDVENIAEQTALARAGFVCEGVLRSAQGRADGRHDLQVWSHVN